MAVLHQCPLAKSWMLWLVLLHAAWALGSGQLHYSVPEESQHGAFVGRIAQDLGLELEELTSHAFRMVSQGHGDYFKVNVQNGILFVNSRIDREELCGKTTVCAIHLEVFLDQPMRVFHVEVEIKDINDNAPAFRAAEQKLTVYESTLPETSFPLEGAFDDDIGANTDLSYKISPNEYFSLHVQNNEKHGESLFLVLRRPLDREVTHMYHLLLTATDAGKPEQTGTAELIISVLDANDNAPVFNQSVYKVKVSENEKKGTLIISLSATDLDEGINKDIAYSIQSVNPSSLGALFHLDANSGQIRLNGELDFESIKLGEIGVEATDKGTPPMKGHCKVLVEVLDVNDNAPEVSVSSLSVPVPEDSPPGTVVALISVSDRDFGANGQVSCSLWPPGLPFQLVSNFRNYYSLVLAEPLDRERVAEYEVAVMAQDQGAPSLSASSSLAVPISDVNDNAPAFAQPSYAVFVRENNPPGAHIFTVSASDPDLAENALLSYWMDENEHFGLNLGDFARGSSLPELVLLQPLDREQSARHQLVLTAVDGGQPARSGSARIDVLVLDTNDNPPAFDRGTYTATLPEDAAPGTLVVKLNASDPDEGSNGELLYSFSSYTPQKVRQLFHVDPVSGEVRVNGTLDYEEASFYEIYVQASDRGPVPMSGHCKVLVQIVDVNDNAPEVVLTSLYSPVREDAQPGTVVALMSVTDQDSGQNGLVSLSIPAGLPFRINAFKNSYTLVTQGLLDWERTPAYNVTVTAADAGTPPLSSHKTIQVDISDINDNAPQFEEPFYSVYVPENNAPGTSLCTARATDPDADENARISYSLLSGEVQGLPVASYVSIHSETGRLHALRSFDYEELREFQVTVRAQDAGTPSLSSTAPVHIYVVDQNDHAPQILYPTPGNASAATEVVPRSAHVGYLVTKVIAVDADSGQNAWLFFRLEQALPPDAFRVEVHSGEVRTMRRLGELNATAFNLTVIVRDNGAPPLSSSVALVVAVADRVPHAVPDSRRHARSTVAYAEATLYLIVALSVVSLVFLMTVVVLAVLKCHRDHVPCERCPAETYKPASFQPHFVEVRGNGSLSRTYCYKACLTGGSVAEQGLDPRSPESQPHTLSRCPTPAPVSSLF
uniref:Protocadherin gamma-C3 n=1 Tax=Varanus komodoensis TaxID=61221 RepID=A0A8D2JDV5_VARKO